MIEYGAESQPGPRPYNEDSQLIRDLSPFSERLGGLLVFLIVSDGMGGHQAGDVASRIAVETAERCIDSLLEGAGTSITTIDPGAILSQVATAADEAIVAEANARGASMGATYVAALATKERAWVAHIGDSRAYLLRGGQAEQLTADHSQVGRMIAEGVLTEEQAQSHPNRNVIERALGFGDGRGPDVREVELQRNDVLLLCTDGMSTILTGTDLAEIVASSRDLREAARDLVGEAIRLGSDDNATVALWSASRSARTITDRGRGRVEHAQRKRRDRRAALRHSRASRASYVVAGVLAAAMIGLLVNLTFCSGQPGGGPAPASQRGTQEASSTTPTQQPQAAGSPQQNDDWPQPVHVSLADDRNPLIRTEAKKAKNNELTLTLRDGLELLQTGAPQGNWIPVRWSRPEEDLLSTSGKATAGQAGILDGYIHKDCLGDEKK